MALNDNSKGSRRGWRAWLLPLSIAVGILVWGFLILAAVGDPPRDWSYGALPYVPSESYASTERPARGAAPAQVQLPPPWPKEKP
jgi:hypothetical protein